MGYPKMFAIRAGDILVTYAGFTCIPADTLVSGNPARRVPFAGLAVLGGSLALVEGLYFIDQDGSLAIEPVDGEPPANSHQVSGPESREFLRAFREAEKQDCAVRFVELQRSTRTLSSISLAACVDFARDGAAQFDFIHVSLPASLDLQPSNPLGPVPRGN